MQLRNVVNHAKKQCNITLNHTTLGTRCFVASISLTDIFVMASCNRRWAFFAFSTWKYITFPSLVFWSCSSSSLQKKAECLWESQAYNTTTCNVCRLSEQDFKEMSQTAYHWPAVNQVEKCNRKSPDPKWKKYSILFLGAFVKMQKATISFIISVCLSVCLSLPWNNSSLTGRIFMNCDTWMFLKNLEKMEVSLKSENNGYFTWRW
jgi:hypothetical protein